MVNYFVNSLKLNLKTKLEYKASVIINSVSQFFVFFTYYFTIVALFTKFSNIKGFNLYEIFICFGTIHFGYAIVEMLFRGLDKFENLIIEGSLDRYLVRPKSILIQVSLTEIDFVKIFRALQALIVIGIALVKLKIKWDIFKILCLLFMLFSSILVFYGVFVIMASYCFLTVEGLEVRNVFTNGGKYLAEYPISIYKKGLRYFFTFIIPYGLINYYPLLFFLGRTNNILYLISPLTSILFLILSIWIFNKGLKRYTSCGS